MGVRNRRFHNCYAGALGMDLGGGYSGSIHGGVVDDCGLYWDTDRCMEAVEMVRRVETPAQVPLSQNSHYERCQLYQSQTFSLKRLDYQTEWL